MANVILVIAGGQSNMLNGYYPSYSAGQLAAMNGNYADFLTTAGDPHSKYRPYSFKNVLTWKSQYPYGLSVQASYNGGSNPWTQVNPRGFIDYAPLVQHLCATSNPGVLTHGWDLPFAVRLRDSLKKKIYVVKMALGGVSVVDTGQPATQEYDPNLVGEFFDYAKAEITAAVAAITALGDTISHVVMLWDQGEANQSNLVATLKANYELIIAGFKTASGNPTNWNVLIRKVFIGNAATAQQQVQAADPTHVKLFDYEQTEASLYNYMCNVPINPVDGIHLMPRAGDWIGENIGDYYLANLYI